MSIAFSVIIPTSGRKELLRKVLLALNVQTVKNFEVIVVDDGSTDGTNNMVKQWVSPYRVKYRYIKKVAGTGAAHARNIGIDVAEGDVVIFLDSDSLIKNNFIEEHIRFHEKQDNLAVVSTRWNLLPQEIDEALIEKGIRKEDLKIDKLESQNRFFDFFSQNLNQFMIPWWFFSTSNASVRRSSIIAAGKFDEGFGRYILYEDTELAYRLFCKGVKFVLNKNADCFHLYHPINEVAKLEFSKGNITYFQQKYPDVPEIALLDLIKQIDWQQVKQEELGWLNYLNAVKRAKGIATCVTRKNYILVVKNQWDELRSYLRILSELDYPESLRVIIIDIGSQDSTDLYIQLIDTKYRLEYYNIGDEERSKALDIGKRKVFQGESIIVEL